MAQKLKAVEANLCIDLDTGIYQVRGMLKGKAFGPYSTGTTSLGKARGMRNTIMARMQEGSDKEQEVPTFAEHWADYRKRKTKGKKTWKHQDIVMNSHILPMFGETRLNALTTAKLEFYIQKRRREKASESTISVELKVAGAVFNDARDNGLVAKNIFKQLEGPRIAIRTQVLSRGDQQKLEAKAPPEIRRFLLFQLATGLRLDEAVNLQPGRDFRWEDHEFRVVGKGSKERWVPILAQSAEALKTIIAEQLEMSGRDQLWTRGEDALRKGLQRACKAAGVAKLGPHTLRHTFATRYLEGGGDIYILSKILGHSSVETTEKVYAHLKPRALAERSAGVEVGVQYAGERL